MKKYKYLISVLLSVVFFASCSSDDNDMTPGNPAMELKSDVGNALFGDSLPFTVHVSDNVPLSTLTINLYFGDEKVSERLIRTKTEGDYSGKIYIPYYKDIPNGTATLDFILMDTHLTSVKKSFDLSVSRPQYPYLILVSGGVAYPMIPSETAYEYVATENFPSTDLPAYIKTPAIGNGNEITFGWESGEITQGVINDIPFTSAQGGVYSVTFNAKTYKATPFFELTVNGQKMVMADKENFQIDMQLTQGQKLTVEGIGNIADWWIDPDFFAKVSDNEFTFVPITGKYRLTANTALQYFRVEAMSGSVLATLQTDGTGAVWIIGDDIGKPSAAKNKISWTTEKGLCMAPMGNKRYQLTIIGGQTVPVESINFKFFHQRGWGGEFSTNLSTTSDIVFVGNGNNGRDAGNLGLVSGVTLEEGAIYVFTVDVSGGIGNAVLTVVKK
ncbi:MAG: DUF5125 domain-containing protein [Dysgonamonadaceae bacterium]|jgi:hypothetical protein|nr:DUF5125 domain-containing protein [Dysgonamonadaceae bacterium]